MYRGNDSIFRFSLIGIAFILVFFLLIIFSRMNADAGGIREEAIASLNQRQQENVQPPTEQALESARQELQARLSGKDVDVDEVINSLLDKVKIEADLAAEKKRAQKLASELIGLSEAKEILTQATRTPALDGTGTETLVSALELRARLRQELASGRSKSKLTDSEIISRALAALNFKQNIESLVEKELGVPLVPGQEPAWQRWLVEDSQEFRKKLTESAMGSAVGVEDSTLRAQVEFFRDRLKALGANVSPPCWFDSAGRVQFLLSIDLTRPVNTRSINVTVEPAWLPSREANARGIRGIDRLLERKQMPYDAFKDDAASIFQNSGQQCRHSVRVKENLRDGRLSEKILQELETLFHLVPG